MTMKYDFAQIEALASALQQNGRNLESQTETLDSAVKSLSSTFTGGSQEAYEEKMASWRSEMSDTQDILNRIATAVREGGQRMAEQDKRSGDAVRASG